MRYILLFLICFGLCAQIPGTFRVSAPVAPPATNSNFGATDTIYGKGGHVTGLSSLSEAQDLNRYPLGRRQIGQLFTFTDGTVYQLQGSTTNFVNVSPRNAKTVATLADLLSLDPEELASSYVGTNTTYSATVTVLDSGNGLPTAAVWNSTSTAETNWVVREVSGFASGRWFVKPPDKSPVPIVTLQYSVGDSIMNGSAVSGVTPWLRFSDIVAQTNGWAVQNGAYGGAYMSDMVWQTFPGYVYTNTGYTPNLVFTAPDEITEEMVWINMVGYNEMRDYGLSTTAQPSMQKSLAAWLAWTALPHENKKYAQDADIITGSWTNSPFFGGDMAMGSSTVTDSLTFSNIVGSTIYVCFNAHIDSVDNRTFGVTIDGTGYGQFTVGPYQQNRESASTNAFQPHYIGPYTNGVIDQGPWVYRFPNLPVTAHTVVLNVGDVTDGPIGIYFVAGNGAQYNPNKGPYAIVGNTLRSTSAGYGNGSDLIAGAYGKLLQATVRQFQEDGLKVLYADVNRYFDPLTMMSGDDVHPTEAGHAAIARAYQDALSPDVGQISAYRQANQNPVLLDGDVVTVRAPSTTGTSYRQVQLTGSTMPFMYANWGAPIVNDSFMEFDFTPNSDTGTQTALRMDITSSQENDGRWIGLYINASETTTGTNGPSYPIVVSNFRTDGTNTTSIAVQRLLAAGGATFEAFTTNSGVTASFLGVGAGSTGTNSSGGVVLHYATEVATNSVRVSHLGGNFLYTVDGSDVVQSIALGNGANVVVVGAADGAGLRLGSSSGAGLFYGTGTGEGFHSAPVGSLRISTDGTQGTTLQTKISGSGNAGWRYVTDDTRVAPTPDTLTDGATITWTMDRTKVSQNASVTLGGARTLDMQSLASGMRGTLRVVQDATGGRTLALGATTNIVNGSKTQNSLSLSPVASGVDIYEWVFISPNVYWTKSYGASIPSPAPGNSWDRLVNFLGTSIKGHSVGVDSFSADGSLTLTDTIARMMPVEVTADCTVTGVGYLLTTAGDFTGDATNSIALYSLNRSTGALTKIAETANDEAIFEGTTGYRQTAFASPVVLAAGYYFIAGLYNNSAQVTAPIIASRTAINSAGGLLDVTSTYRFTGHFSGSEQPSSINLSALSASGTLPFYSLY